MLMQLFKVNIQPQIAYVTGPILIPRRPAVVSIKEAPFLRMAQGFNWVIGLFRRPANPLAVRG